MGGGGEREEERERKRGKGDQNMVFWCFFKIELFDENLIKYVFWFSFFMFCLCFFVEKFCKRRHTIFINPRFGRNQFWKIFLIVVVIFKNKLKLQITIIITMIIRYCFLRLEFSVSPKAPNTVEF